MFLNCSSLKSLLSLEELLILNFIYWRLYAVCVFHLMVLLYCKITSLLKVLVKHTVLAYNYAWKVIRSQCGPNVVEVS